MTVGLFAIDMQLPKSVSNFHCCSLPTRRLWLCQWKILDLRWAPQQQQKMVGEGRGEGERGEKRWVRPKSTLKSTVWKARSRSRAGVAIDWCCFYYFVWNSPVALLEALYAKENGAPRISPKVSRQLQDQIWSRKLWKVSILRPVELFLRFPSSRNFITQCHGNPSNLVKWIQSLSADFPFKFSASYLKPAKMAEMWILSGQWPR